MTTSIAKFIILASSGKESLEETLGRIVKGDIVGALQELLKKEYLQRDTYDSYRYLFFSPMGINIKDHLEEHLADEMSHIDTLQRYIVSLGEIPTLERYEIPKCDTQLKALMEMNLGLETETVELYSAVIKGLESLDKSKHVALISDLEDIVVSEQEHCHDLERWLKEGL